MRSPISTERMVMVPAKGAMTRWKETNSSNRRTSARLASTLAAAVSRPPPFPRLPARRPMRFSTTPATARRWSVRDEGWPGPERVELWPARVAGPIPAFQSPPATRPACNMRADIGHPVFEVAVGTRIDGGFPPWPDFRRQDQSAPRPSQCRRDDGNRRDRQFVHVRHGRLTLMPTREKTDRE